MTDRKVAPKKRRRNPERYTVNAEMSLEEVAKILGLSRERIRQIEMLAIRKIRSPLVSRKLREYLDE